MPAEKDDYAAFLLRMWREDMDGLHTWRVALQDALTLDEQHFANLEGLIGFLRFSFSDTESNATDKRRER